jgi:hypothetical protein
MTIRLRGLRDMVFTAAGGLSFAAVLWGIQASGDNSRWTATAAVPAMPVGTHVVVLPVGEWRPIVLTCGDSEDMPKEVRLGEKSWACPPGSVAVIRAHLTGGAIHVEVTEGPLKGSFGFANPENIFWIADGVIREGR